MPDKPHQDKGTMKERLASIIADNPEILDELQERLESEIVDLDDEKPAE